MSTSYLTIHDLNLHAAERLIVETALQRAGSIVDAAKLLGITRHAVKRRIIKHNIRWTRERTAPPEAAGVEA